MKPFNVDIFVALKKKHGRLAYYNTEEEGEWQVWKHEYGWPKEFFALMFVDGKSWNRKDAEQEEVF